MASTHCCSPTQVCIGKCAGVALKWTSSDDVLQANKVSCACQLILPSSSVCYEWEREREGERNLHKIAYKSWNAHSITQRQTSYEANFIILSVWWTDGSTMLQLFAMADGSIQKPMTRQSRFRNISRFHAFHSPPRRLLRLETLS